MKPVERVLDVNGTLGGEKVGMTIDHSALAHIMSVLTDLYSDPELAVIREYSTNALDSHIEAGQTRPIEVTLPSPLSPFLRIRDYGVGMDADDIRDTYSRYGTSTKRNSDDVVGMLGLGCKSALTYADQFTLTGIKDGRMIQVSIGRDEDGSGSMSIVADHPTDQPAGVEVIIPAKRHHEFEGKAFDFFRFWTPGTVLVNGEQPKRIDGQWITDRLLIVPDGLDSDYVVMGNVAYPVPDDTLSANANGSRRPYYQNNRTVAFVEIGAVQFTPSRESLQMTKLTKDTLAEIKAERDSKLHAAMQANVENAATPFEAIQVWSTAKNLGVAAPMTYRGQDLRSAIWRDRAPDAHGNVLRQQDVYLVATPGRNSRYRLTGVWQGEIGLEPGNMFFEHFDGATFTNVKRAKLDQYLTRTGYDMATVARYVFVRGPLNSAEKFWTSGATVIDWKDVDAEKLPRDPSTKQAGPRGAYKGRGYDGSWDKPIMASAIDTKRPILYHQGNRYSLQQSWEMRQSMIPAGALIVCLEMNRVEKFLRDFPTAQSTSAYATASIKNQIDGWDALKLKAARFQRVSGTHLLSSLPADRINDPKVTEGIQLAKMDVSAIAEKLITWRHLVPDGEVPSNPLDKYPLLATHRSLDGKVTIDHAVTYINAAYAADRS